MASLTGQTIASTYDALLKISDNGAINGTLKQITDGLGNNTPLYLSGNTVSIDGSFKLTGRLFDKNNEPGLAGQFLVSSGDGVDWQNISESGLITGLGTASFLSKFTAGGVIADSIISESASGIGIGITATQKLHVLGNGLFTGTLNSSNLSGSNTGDETKSSIETKLGAATSSNDGYLTSTNWSTFNAKQPALNGLGFVKIDGTTISYDNSTYALASRNIATTSPLSGGGDLSANRSLSIAKSDSLTDGYLAADDFVNFNSKVPSARTITINGQTFDLSANRTYAVNVGVTSFNTRVGAVSLSSLDVTNALGYTPAINSRIMTINGVGYSLAADRTWNVGTVTSVGTSAPLTGGNITTSGTIGITKATTSVDGYLSATDWNTFNNKQANLGYTPENLANKGVNNGYASLGGDGKVPSTQLPSYVDDVVEVANFAALPATGETGKIYVTLDNDFVYRWSGSVYVRISSPNAIWGSITGTLSNQIDLQNALNAKVSSVGLDLGTSGTDVNVANSPITSSGNITLNLPTASATNRGLLSSANWTTFNNKQNAITLTTTGTSGASTLVGSTLNIPQYQPQLSGTGFVKISGTTISYDNSSYALASAISGTTNYIPKFTGANTIGNSLVRDDGSGVSIGIAPQTDKLFIYNSGGTNTGLTIQQDGAGDIFRFNGNSGANRLVLQQGGNLGLGVTPSAWGSSIAMQIGSKASIASVVNDLNLSNNAFYNGSNWIYLTNSVATNYYQSAGNHVWRNAIDGTAGNAITFTQAMTLGANGILSLPSSGSLEIGYTSSPSLYKLDVNGTGRFVGSLQVGSGSGGSGTQTQSDFQDTFGGIRSVIYVRNTADYSAGRGSGYSIQNGEGVEKASLQIRSNDASQTGYSLELVNVGAGSLTIASTGAATFSSSVTIQNGNALILNNSVNTSAGSVICPGGGSLSLRSYGQDMIYLNENDNIRFSTSSSEKMRITSGGNVLIGTATTSGDYKLEINGRIKTNTGYAQDSGDVSMASNTPTTIYTISGIRGLYTIYVSVPSQDSLPANYSAYAIIAWDSASAKIMQQTNAGNLFITLSSNNIQVEQTNGATQSVTYRLIKIA